MESKEPAELSGARECPFCPQAHRLRLHGWYKRWAHLPEGEGFTEVELRIRRLLCPLMRRTVSLLPSFCLPRRYYGPAALGVFLDAYVFALQSLVVALRRVHPQVTHHSVAQSLIAGFLRRQPQLTAFLGGLRLRTPDPPAGLSGRRLAAARLLLPLRQGFTDSAAALHHHGVPFHQRFGLGIA